MNIYAIGDLHLSYSNPEKSMEKFGWKDYQSRIFQDWQEKVTNADIVFVVGDISWAMKIEDAYIDLEKIAVMKGKKIFIKGNHDYWWQSISKIKNYNEDMYFIQNDIYELDDYVVCGVRGWLSPNDLKFDEQDEKLYKRETIRLRQSLELAKTTQKKIIVLLHFPPTNDKKEESNFSKLIQEYNVDIVIYGHLHGKESFNTSYEGLVNNTFYHLVSADYLDFKLKKIL